MESRAEKSQSLEIPSKLKNNIFNSETQSDCKENECVQQELEEVRTSRATPLNKRWKPEERTITRSRSSVPVGRLKLPDDCWVLERPSSLLIEEEKEKRLLELEDVKQVRLEQAEMLELDRPSSRLEVQARHETLKELEQVKHIRQARTFHRTQQFEGH